MTQKIVGKKFIGRKERRKKSDSKTIGIKWIDIGTKIDPKINVELNFKNRQDSQIESKKKYIKSKTIFFE